MKLKNLMEDAVAYTLEDIKKRYDFCGCENCRLDIIALALNQIAPRYVVTEKGDSYSRADWLDLQKGVDILGIVLNAVKTVQGRPRHDQIGGE
ncbi:MAG: late competence development ComFB family protein [Bacillota bacterium]